MWGVIPHEPDSGEIDWACAGPVIFDERVSLVANKIFPADASHALAC